mgnify:CR=1 FL=1
MSTPASGTPAAALFDLSGRTAVVTGALGRLGPVWCRALLDAGARVAALDLPDARPSEAFLRLRVKTSEDRLRVIRADVTVRASLEAARGECERTLGPVGVLVNNAGIDAPPGTGGGRAGLLDIPAEAARRILDVNVVGLFTAAQVFAAGMIAARRGSIINIGSLYASVSPDARFYDHMPGEPPFLKPPMYGAGKAAVVNLTKYLATHLAPHGVRVNALSPGGVAGGQDEEFLRKFTARVPLARMATDADLAGPLLFLAGDASAYVTGTELRVDGGFTAW